MAVLIERLPQAVQPIVSNPLNLALVVVLLHVVRAALRPWAACLQSPSKSPHFLLLYPTLAEAKLRGVPGNAGAAVGPFSRPPALPFGTSAGGGGFHGGGDPVADALARQQTAEAAAQVTRIRWRNFLRRLAHAPEPVGQRQEQSQSQGQKGGDERKEALHAARCTATIRTRCRVWAHPTAYPTGGYEELGYSSMPTYHPDVSVWRRYTPRTLALFDGAGLVISEAERARVADPRRDQGHNPHTGSGLATSSKPTPSRIADAQKADTDGTTALPSGHPSVADGANGAQCPASAFWSKQVPSRPIAEPDPEPESKSEPMPNIISGALPPGHPPVPTGTNTAQCPGMARLGGSSGIPETQCPALKRKDSSPPVLTTPTTSASKTSESAIPTPDLLREQDAEEESEEMVGGYCGPSDISSSSETTSSTGAGTILIGINGRVFDVSSGRAFYGPGGPYGNFAGRDATLGLAKNSFDPDILPSLHDKPLIVPLSPISQPQRQQQAVALGEEEEELSPVALAARNLTKSERYALADWIEMFETKYGVVGELVPE